jgi:hypothetical protein
MVPENDTPHHSLALAIRMPKLFVILSLVGCLNFEYSADATFKMPYTPDRVVHSFGQNELVVKLGKDGLLETLTITWDGKRYSVPEEEFAGVGYPIFNMHPPTVTHSETADIPPKEGFSINIPYFGKEDHLMDAVFFFWSGKCQRRMRVKSNISSTWGIPIYIKKVGEPEIESRKRPSMSKRSQQSAGEAAVPDASQP